MEVSSMKSRLYKLGLTVAALAAFALQIGAWEKW